MSLRFQLLASPSIFALVQHDRWLATVKMWREADKARAEKEAKR